MGVFDFIRNSVRMPEMYRDTLRSESARKSRELLQQQTANASIIREEVRRGCNLYKRNKKQSNHSL